MEIGNASPVVEKHWRPFPKQAKFIAIPDSVFEGFFAGSKGPGKTDTLVMLDVVRGFIEHPKFKSLMLRRNFPDLEQEVVGRQKEWYAPMGAVYNETKKRWTWPSGAISQNGHADKEDDVRKYDSAEYNLIKWDEATHFIPFQYQYLSFTRCRSSSPDLPAIVRAGSNPGNIGHTYFRTRFVDPYRPGGKILIDKVTGLKRIFIPATVFDNPKLLKDNPNYLAQLNTLPEAEKRAAYGDWYTFSGQVFTEWRLEPLGGEPENAQHVIKPFDVPFWWPKILAIDWGFAALTVVGWGAISPEGRVYIYRTYAVKGKQIKDWATEIANISGSENIVDAVICHSAAQQRGEPHTIQQQVQSALDGAGLEVSLRLGERDRLGGKMILHEYLRWKERPPIKASEAYNHTLAMNILSIYGEKKYEEYLSFFREYQPETNLPKLQIFETPSMGQDSNVLVDCIPECIYDDKDSSGKPAEDVKEFNGDDPYDMVRMLLRHADDYVKGAHQEFEARKKIEKVYAELNATGNQTSFYRNMEKMEAETSSDGYSVRAHKRLGRGRR